MDTKLIHPDRGYYKEIVNSTNLEIHSPDYPSGSYLVAGEQTSGKGRGDHKWESLGFNNLFFSSKIELSINQLSPIPLISLLIGGAVLRTLHSLQPDRAEKILLKWPNDIFLDGNKIGGILIETYIQGKNLELIVGIGINLYNSKKDEFSYSSLFPAEPDEAFRKKMISLLITELNTSLNKWISNDHSESLEFISKYSYLFHKEVSTEINGEIITGKAIGYTGEGYLIIQSNEKLFELHDTINNFKILTGTEE